MRIPSEDFEHAWVEGFACEILRRAGYSDSDIKRGYAVFLGALDRQFDELVQRGAAQGVMVMPATDVESRRWSVMQYFLDSER